MNDALFVFIGDVIHLIAAISLPIKIWNSKNCAGVSGKTQILYAVHSTVPCLYLPIGLYNRHIEYYILTLKLVHIATAYITLYLIYVKFKDSYSQHEDSIKINYVIYIAAILAVMFNHGYSGGVITYPEIRDHGLHIEKIMWSFFIFLEVVAIVPQLLMVYQDKTNETRSFILYYLYAMGAYRVLYTIHGMYRYFNHYSIDNVVELAGAVQMTIYALFVGIYLNRSTPYSYYSELFEPPITVYI